MTNMGYRAYQTTRIETSSPGQLIQLLYDEAYRSARLGLDALQAKDFETANHRLIKVQEILTALMGALDFNIPLSQNLYQLYDFIHDRLVQANVKKNAALVEETLPLLKELRDTWAELQRTGTGQQAVAAGGTMRGGFSGDA